MTKLTTRSERTDSAGFGGDTVSMPEDRFFQVAESLGVLDLLRGLPSDQAMIESGPARIEVFRKQLNRLGIANRQRNLPLPLTQAMGNARTSSRPDSMISRRSRSLERMSTSFSAASFAMMQSIVDRIVTPLDRSRR